MPPTPRAKRRRRPRSAGGDGGKAGDGGRTGAAAAAAAGDDELSEMDAAAGGEAAQTTAAPADSRADRPRAGAARGQPARREGPRREGRIRHRHWREHESKPDGAAAPCRRLRRQHIPYCYPTVATVWADEAPTPWSEVHPGLVASRATSSVWRKPAVGPGRALSASRPTPVRVDDVMRESTPAACWLGLFLEVLPSIRTHPYTSGET